LVRWIDVLCWSLALFGATEGLRCSAEIGNAAFAIHDPSRIVKFRDRYWVFFTGRGGRSAWSFDRTNWTQGPPIFPNKLPEWAASAAPRNNGDVWAPDIVFLNGKFYLYYCISVFGKNTSGIGVATNPTLDPRDPNYHWSDQGIVIQTSASDKYNALDPCPVLDADQRLWLAFGSYWTGIKLIRLNSNTGKRIAPHSPMWPLAYHSSIEAAYIHYHAGWYYLFVNWDRCCRGTNSTYNIRVGRSRVITGPYIDKTGVKLIDNGGSLFRETSGRFIGPGHVGIFAEGTNEWVGVHVYDAKKRGRPALDLRRLTYDVDGWPVVESP
jgi:arabinan endo-1,5-alpha-L-arabinosidase